MELLRGDVEVDDGLLEAAVARAVHLDGELLVEHPAVAQPRDGEGRVDHRRHGEVRRTADGELGDRDGQPLAVLLARGQTERTQVEHGATAC